MAIVIFKYEESILSKNQHNGNDCVQPTLVVDWVIRLSGGDTGQATRCREEIDLKLILEMMGSVMIFWVWNHPMFHVIGNIIHSENYDNFVVDSNDFVDGTCSSSNEHLWPED